MTTRAAIPPSAFPVALVSMPWAKPQCPSVQLGVLKSATASTGYPVDAHHFYLDLCRRMDRAVVEKISDVFGLGDWLFSAVMDPSRRTEDRYAELEEVAAGGEPRLVFSRWSQVETAIQRLEAYLDELATSVPWADYRVVGFSTVFDQTLPSVALARRIKELDDPPKIVFGGANVDGEMGAGVLETFDCIDYCVTGEGERAFPELLDVLRTGVGGVDDVAGVFHRTNGDVVRLSSEPELIEDLDGLPSPDYREYFTLLEASGLSDDVKPTLVMETSRGCWFARCLFCGLNRHNIRYRTKSPRRAREQLTELAGDYGCLSVFMADNVLAVDYIDSFLEEVAELRASGDCDVSLFYEIKSNLRKRYVAALSRAGVRHVQIGVESFVNSTLRRMRKGTTIFKNIEALKWCQQYGIYPAYNIIYDFPGQPYSDLAKERSVMSGLLHLHPPNCVTPLLLQRFSPYFRGREAFGFEDVRPAARYAVLYGESAALDKLAFMFDYSLGRDSAEQQAVEREVDELQDFVRGWQRSFRPGRLTYRVGPGFVSIRDRRDGTPGSTVVLRGAASRLYRRCEETTPLSLLRSEFDREGLSLDDRVVDGLVEDGLVFRRGDKVLGLAVRDRSPDEFVFGVGRTVRD